MIDLVQAIEPKTTEQGRAGVRPTDSQQTTEQTDETTAQEMLVNYLELELLEARDKLQAMYEEQVSTS